MVEQYNQLRKTEKGLSVTRLHSWHLVSSQNRENDLHWQVINDNLQQSWCQGKRAKGTGRKLEALVVLLEVLSFFSYTTRPALSLKCHL